MKTINLLTVLVGLWLCLLAGVVLSADLSSPLGDWKTIDDETGKVKSIVTIWEENGRLYGKVKEILDPNASRTCRNCEGELKDAPIEGMRILWDLQKEGDEWTKGTIFDPAKGKEYRSSLRLTEGGHKLEVTGHLFVFSRSQTWERVP